MSGSGRTEISSLPLSPVPDDAAEGDDDVTGAPLVESAAIMTDDRGLLPQLSKELALLRERIDVVQQDVAALVARLHTLGGAITGVETSLGERLAEYADTVVQLGRGLTANVSTYREGSERSVSELRRALADSEELLRSVLTRADDLAVEIAAVRHELTALPEDDSLDADEVRAIVHEAVEPFDVRDEIANLGTALSTLGDRLSREIAASAAVQPSGSNVDAAMQAELLSALEAMRADVERLRRAESRPSKTKAAVEHEQALVAELEAMREEIAQLKRRIAVRAKASGIDDEQISSIVERVRGAIDVRLPDAELERVAAAVARRMAEAFEVVPDDEPAPAPEPAPARRSRASSSRRS